MKLILFFATVALVIARYKWSSGRQIWRRQELKHFRALQRAKSDWDNSIRKDQRFYRDAA